MTKEKQKNTTAFPQSTRSCARFWRWSCLFLLLIWCSEIGGFIYRQNRQQIPKIIHYVWLGDKEKLASFQPVINSWKKQAPEYQLMLWDEERCGIQDNPHAKGFYDRGQYAFASDYCRLKALSEYGGLYLDTDHFLTQNPSHLLKGHSLVLTYEHNDALSASFMASVPHHPFWQHIIQKYNNLKAKDYTTLNALITLTARTKLHVPRFGGRLSETSAIRLLPANVAMLDFGGGENVAKHTYAGGNTLHVSPYYDWFKQLFLQQVAPSVHSHQNPKICEYLVPRWDNTFYRLSDRANFSLLKETETHYVFRQKENQHLVSFKKCVKRP